MRTPVRTLSILIPVLCAALACGKSEGGAATKGQSLTLDKVGNLKIDVPAGSTVGDGVVTGNMVTGPGIVVSVEYASDTRPKTADEAQKEAADSSPKNLKSETLADGWIVTFDNTGSLGKNFFVQARRTLGGKAVWCETTASQPEQAENAIAACKSLKP